MSRKAPRFPFLISPYENKTSAHEGSSTLASVLEEMGKVLSVQQGIRDEVSLLGGKLALLQSAMTDLAGRKPAAAGEQPDREWEGFFLHLMPLLDSLDSLRAAIAQSGKDSWQRGIELFRDKIHSLFTSHGLEPSAEEGMPFDPACHEAVGAQTDPQYEPGTVAEVIQSGWRYRGKILRYAKVIVAKGGSR